MYPKIVIIHKPQITFPKYTVRMDNKTIHVANSVDPSELLEKIGIPHIYKIEVPDAK